MSVISCIPTVVYTTFVVLLSSSSLWIYASVGLSVFDHRLLTTDLKVVLGEVTI